ncbi:MAG: sensor histidine kinase [Rectinema subterraneum]|uniref:sensor histidine kinase n=1 Tax=Rectinema subterraneum TaxID=2653714 RepID=UPI003C7ED9EF
MNDLDSRSLLEMARGQVRHLLSSLPDIVYILDEQGHFVFLNEAAALLGYEPSALIGKHFSVIIHPEDRPNISRDIVVEKIRQANKFPEIAPKLFDERRSGERMTRELEVRLVHRDGHIIYGLVNAYGERDIDVPLLADLVGSAHTIGIIHDISAMHLYQQSLEESLAAKEQLLREIHHRVKTNLQLVASLAHLKQLDSARRDTSEVLRELEAQVKSIALVHEALYNSEQIDRISAGTFFAQFCHAAEEALESVGSTVHLRFSSADCSLDPDRLVPLALATLEILGGAYRFAFEKRAETEIRLDYRCLENGEQVLELEGEGMLSAADSMVLHALLRQANARLETEVKEGARQRCRMVLLNHSEKDAAENHGKARAE